MVDLDDPSNITYLLGRNSSGKSSFLAALEYIDHSKNLGEHPNFSNYDPTPDPAHDHGRVRAIFQLADENELKFKRFTQHVTEMLSRKKVQMQWIMSEKKSADPFAAIMQLYQVLISELNTSRKFIVEKFAEGYRILEREDYARFNSRVKEVASFVAKFVNKSGATTLGGTNVTLSLDAVDFETCLALQMPRIDVFNSIYPLNHSLPDRITGSDIERATGLTAAFIGLLGSNDVIALLKTNNPDTQSTLLAKLQGNIDDLLAQVNDTKYSDGKTPFVKVIPHLKDGIQFTVSVDGKYSFFRNISDNTKFLFSYYVYKATRQFDNGVLLFDEPSNGFHPTTQDFLRQFFSDLASSGVQLVIATHSEYLIDLDGLASVRLMGKDEHGQPTVKPHFYTRPRASGDYFALRPILDAIGIRFGAQITVRDKVVLTEGVTDLLYLRAFRQILGVEADISIAPLRGDSQFAKVLPLFISQGISIKIVLDKGHAREELMRDFGIEARHIWEVPVPDEYEAKFHQSGIEDLFSKKDFRALLEGEVKPSFDHVPNSAYLAQEYGKGDPMKRLIAHDFYKRAATIERDDLEPSTLAAFQDVLEFCATDDWYEI